MNLQIVEDLEMNLEELLVQKRSNDLAELSAAILLFYLGSLQVDSVLQSFLLLALI